MRSLTLALFALSATHAAAGPQDDGAALYATHCAACHGATLEGAPDWQQRGPDGLFPAPPHDETGHTWHHGDGFLFAYTKYGGQAVLDELGVPFTSAMPAFEGVLDDAEIDTILAFIRESWPPQMRAFQAARTEDERAAGQFLRE